MGVTVLLCRVVLPTEPIQSAKIRTVVCFTQRIALPPLAHASFLVHRYAAITLVPLTFTSIRSFALLQRLFLACADCRHVLGMQRQRDGGYIQSDR